MLLWWYCGCCCDLYFWFHLWPAADSSHSTHTCQASILYWDAGCPILRGVLIVCNRLWSPPSLPLCPRGWEPVSVEKNTSGCFLSLCLCWSCRVGILCHVAVVRCRLALHSWSYLHFFCLWTCTLIKYASLSGCCRMLVLDLLCVNSRSLLLLHYALFSVLSFSSSVFWSNCTHNTGACHPISPNGVSGCSCPLLWILLLQFSFPLFYVDSW